MFIRAKVTIETRSRLVTVPSGGRSKQTCHYIAMSVTLGGESVAVGSSSESTRWVSPTDDE